MNRPKHPREIALEQKLVDLVTDPREAAKRLLHHAYHLSRRKEPPYQELLIESLKMGAKALECQAEEEEKDPTSFWDDAMEIMNDMTNAQVEEAIKYLELRRSRKAFSNACEAMCWED